MVYSLSFTFQSSNILKKWTVHKAATPSGHCHKDSSNSYPFLQCSGVGDVVGFLHPRMQWASLIPS